MTCDRNPDVYALMARHWPVDGPHDTDSCASAATAIAELVRYLNHATRSQDVLPFASDGYTLAGRLAEAAGRLAQLMQQLGAWADHLAADPTLRHDQYRDTPELAAEAATDVAGWCVQANRRAEALARALTAGQNRLAPLWHDIDGAGSDER